MQTRKSKPSARGNLDDNEHLDYSKMMTQSFLEFCTYVKKDPMIMLIPMIVGHRGFIDLMKTMAGKTVTFPTHEELLDISKKSEEMMKFLQKNRETVSPKVVEELDNIITVANSYTDLSREDRVRVKITSALLTGYFTTLFSKLDTISKAVSENTTPENVLEIYKIRVRDLEVNGKLMEALAELERIKKWVNRSNVYIQRKRLREDGLDKRRFVY